MPPTAWLRNTHILRIENKCPCSPQTSAVSHFFSIPSEPHRPDMLSWICYPNIYHTEAEYLSKCYTFHRSVRLISISSHPHRGIIPRSWDSAWQLEGSFQISGRTGHILIAVGWWFIIVTFISSGVLYVYTQIYLYNLNNP